MLTKRSSQKRHKNNSLYESIMRDVSKVVKRHLNENKFDGDFHYWNPSSHIWEVCDNPAAEKFFDKTIEYFEDWIHGTGDETIDSLIQSGKLVEGETEWDDAADMILNEFAKLLDQAIGGDWWQMGEKLGYSDLDTDRLWNDVMQSKTDCICSYDFPGL